MCVLQELLLQTTQFQGQATQHHPFLKDLQHRQLPQGQLLLLHPIPPCHLPVPTISHSLHRLQRLSSCLSPHHPRTHSNNKLILLPHHQKLLLRPLHCQVLHSLVLIWIFRALVWQVCRGPWPVYRVCRMFRYVLGKKYLDVTERKEQNVGENLFYEILHTLSSSLSIMGIIKFKNIRCIILGEMRHTYIHTYIIIIIKFMKV